MDTEVNSVAFVDWKLMSSPLVLSRTAKSDFLVITSKIPFLGGLTIFGIDSSGLASK